MAEGTTACPRAVVENENKIPSRTVDSRVLLVQKGMSDLERRSSSSSAKATYYYDDNHNNYTINYNSCNSNISNNINNNNVNNGYNNIINSNNINDRNYNSANVSVDSALLAAMRDPRERFALLRLEQVMIDFINSSDGYLEVGGAYNSLVVTPNKMTNNGLNLNNFNSSGVSSSGSNNGGGVEVPPVPVMSAMSSASMASLSTYGMRPATSFQRCLLHRLADRFGILRETGSLMDGSIRLVKQKDSKIPQQLLVNFSTSSGSNNITEGTEDMGQATGVPAAASTNDVAGACNAMAGLSVDPRDPRSTLQTTYNPSNLQHPSVVGSSGGIPAGTPASTPGPGGLAGGKSSSKRKMKIMKRMSSGADSNKSASSGGANNSSATPRSRKSKNFSDKEKAYAEARARIFNGESPPTTGPSTVTPLETSFSNTGNSSGPSATSTPPPSQHPDSLPLSKAPSTSSLQNEDEDTSHSATSSSAIPAASTGMGVAPSKATWRNRRQEENDPDFQRGTLLTTAAASASTPIHPQSYTYYAQQGYPPPQQPSYPTSAGEDAAHYFSYSKVSGGRGTATAPTAGGRGGRGYASIQQSSPRSSPAAYTNQYRYLKTAANHHHHHHHNHHQETTNLNCMEEFPALP